MAEEHSGFKLLNNIDGNSDTYKAENMADPSAAQDYVTKAYGDANYLTVPQLDGGAASTSFGGVAASPIDGGDST